MNDKIEKTYNKFLKFLIETTKLYEVRNNKVYVSGTIEENQSPIEIGENKLHIQLFDIPVSDDENAVILNPINETYPVPIENKWLYSILIASIATKIQLIIKYMFDLKNIQDELPIKVLKELSKYAEQIDSKTLNEMNIITENFVDFINIYYNKSTREAYLRTGIFEKSFIAKHNKKIRKKTFAMLDLFLCNLFNIKSTLAIDEKRKKLRKIYYCTTDDLRYPKFKCITRVYYKILYRFNILFNKLDMTDDDLIIDLSEYNDFLESTDEFYKKSKWCSPKIYHNKINQIINQKNQDDYISTQQNQSFVFPGNYNSNIPTMNFFESPLAHAFQDFNLIQPTQQSPFSSIHTPQQFNYSIPINSGELV